MGPGPSRGARDSPVVVNQAPTRRTPVTSAGLAVGAQASMEPGEYEARPVGRMPAGTAQ